MKHTTLCSNVSSLSLLICFALLCCAMLVVTICICIRSGHVRFFLFVLSLYRSHINAVMSKHRAFLCTRPKGNRCSVCTQSSNKFPLLSTINVSVTNVCSKCAFKTYFKLLFTHENLNAVRLVLFAKAG